MTLRSIWALVVAAGLSATAHAAPGAASSASAAAEATRPTVSAAARHQPIIPLADVHAGMKGYGLTVFQGTRPERFDIRVIGVLHNFLPKQDIILIQSDDPRLLHSGIVAGMSGSPIYLDGKLAGALAYGWHFAKDPIAGVTPIESMLEEAKRPLRGRERTPMAEAANEPQHQPRSTARSLDDVIARRADERRQSPLLSRFPLPPALVDGAEPRLARASVPLSLAGFTAGAFSELTDAFAPYHMVPLQAGGAGRSDTPGPAQFEDGGSIAVQLIRGDVSAAATGTVTHVDGTRVLAFGHPMFNVGEIYLPIATAEIHTFLSALSSSFKMASPIKEIGSLTQDRQSGIVGDTAQRADMIPVNITVGGPGRGEHTFHAEVVRHRFLTPMLSSTVIANAAQTFASDVADATITVRSKLNVRGYKPLELTDHLYSPDGVSPRTLAASSGLRAIGDILFNPFAPANLDRIDVAVDVEYKADVADIVGISLNSDELEPGSRPSLYVTLRPYNGPEYVQAVPFDVPRSLAGQTIKVVTTAGNGTKPDVAPPENLGGLIENLRKSYPARSIVVSLETPDEGVTLRGSVIPDLPGSIIDTLRPDASTRRADTFKRASRFVVPTHGIVQGKQEITVRVKNDQNQ
ncbi:MAG TPA: SpoIVB peptidase S55 domain-containing protein [Polyangia bacterium]|nr:SpoIVB peptidase S55 domain-containing protein [Polyangia bacterium]